MPINLNLDVWRNLIYDIYCFLVSKNDLCNFMIKWKDWRKLLKKYLESFIKTDKILNDKELKLGNIRKGETENFVIKSLNNKESVDIDVHTIHSCKGMTLDSILFFSTYQASNQEDNESGKHWLDWFDCNNIEEKNRIAYVAFSRAKYYLAIAVPKTKSLTNEKLMILNDYGFKIVE